MGEGNQFEGSILDNNTVRILDGNGLMYGRHFRMQRNTYEDITITTGTAGKNRADLICMTYEKNGNDGTEKACLQVVKGVETEGEAVTPDFTDGNILEGASFNQMPLYKVLIKGVVLSEIVPLFQVIPTYKELAEKYAAEFKKACTTHLSSLAVLDTLEEIEANTQEKQLAGALAVKELNETVASQNETLAQCLKSVSDGKSKVAGAITAQGVNTAADAAFETMSANISTVGTQKYNSGYNAGVTAADNRANAASVNYKTGYNNGYSAGRNQLINLNLTKVNTTSLQYNLNATVGDYYFIDIVYFSGSGYSPGILSGANVIWSRTQSSMATGAGFLGHFVGVVQATATMIALRTGDASINGNVLSTLCYAKIN